MSDFFETLFKVILFVVIVCAVIAGIVAAVGYGLDQPACYAKGEQMGHNVKWGFWSGCMIEVREGEWFPVSQYIFDENSNKK